MIRRGNLLRIGFVAVVIGIAATASVAAQSSSPHYEVNQVFFGSGGSLDSTSTNYQSQQSLGELTVGNTKSPNYQAYGGFNTTDVPELSMNVTGGTFDLGTLSTSATASVSTTFSVENYLSHGYVVEYYGNPLNLSGGYTMHTYTSPTTPTTGVEQFGINLAANTSPSVGAAPQQVPDSTFSFGAIAHNYNEGGSRTSISYDSVNQFLFDSGDVVAYSSSSSGETTYTLSAIADQAAFTPAGEYGTTLSLVAVPTF